MGSLIVLSIGISIAHSTSLSQILLNFLGFYIFGGVMLMWTFTEYYFHTSKHGEHSLNPEGEGEGDYLVEIFSGHLSHHVFMNQKYRIAIGLSTYLKYVGGGWFILQFFVPATILYMQFAGWVTGSLLYDGFHLAYHFNWPIPGAYF